MADLSFGLSLAVVGMGGTLATLWFLGLVLNVLKKILSNHKPEGGA